VGDYFDFIAHRSLHLCIIDNDELDVVLKNEGRTVHYCSPVIIFSYTKAADFF
jgi:hypothetical protein